MKKTSVDPVHVWLVMMKAYRAIAKRAMLDLQVADVGDSDFRVLEVLLHKGPLPVNTIGPMVDLTPGSISVAVDRLHRKGLVSRTESAEDRRIRTVALTKTGMALICPLFRKHSDTIAKIFSELTGAELAVMEAALKKIGRRAEFPNAL